MPDQLIVALFLLFLALLLALNVGMLISLGRQGDERRRMIVGRASANTFFVTVVYLCFRVGENLYRGMAQGLPAQGLDPFITLSVLAMMYAVQLIYFKRRFGG